MSAIMLESLLDQIRRSTPDLPAARCKGNSELFDAETDEDADAAIRTCLNYCPALSACRAWVDSLPKSKRPHGIVARELHTYQPRTRKRAS